MGHPGRDLLDVDGDTFALPAGGDSDLTAWLTLVEDGGVPATVTAAILAAIGCAERDAADSPQPVAVALGRLLPGRASGRPAR